MRCPTLIAAAGLSALLPFLLLAPPGAAFLLPECAKNVTKSPAVCCPVPKGHKTACGFPTRGICRPTQTYKEPAIDKFKAQFKHDPRIHWPRRVFDYGCECIGLHWGQDCGECWFGYAGPNCQYRTMFVRRRASKMTKKQRKYFTSVLAKAATLKSRFVVPTGIPKNKQMQGPWKSTNIIEGLVYMHWFAAYQFQSHNRNLCKKTPAAKRMDFCSGQPNFIMFHRLLSLAWEREMQRVGQKYFHNGNWTWPYFDWTNKKKCTVCTDDLVGSETGPFDRASGGNRLSSKSPFHNWHAYCSTIHRPACSNCLHTKSAGFVTRRWVSSKFPRAADVRRVLQMPMLYNMSSMCYSFSYMLGSGKGCFCNANEVRLDAQVTKMIHGTMARTAASASDPLFFLHHANLDRLFARWFREVLPSNFEIPTYHAQFAGGCRQCAIVPFLPPITNEDVLSETEALGYIYEDFDFGPVKASEKIASPFNVYVSPKDRGCSKKKKKKKATTGKKKKATTAVKTGKKSLDEAETAFLTEVLQDDVRR